MNFGLSRKGQRLGRGHKRNLTDKNWLDLRMEPHRARIFVDRHSRSARPLLADRAAVHHSIEAQPRRRCPGAGSPVRVRPIRLGPRPKPLPCR